MNHRMTVLSLALSLFSGALCAQDRGPSPRADAQSGHPPPPQAYEDCRGKQVGATVQHMTREGPVAATCADSPEGLVARPNQPPKARSERPAAP